GRSARRDGRIQPRPALGRVPDAHRSARGPCEEGAPRATVQIERHVEPLRAELSGHGEIVTPSSGTGSSPDDDHLVEMRVAADDGGRGRFNEIGEMRPGKVPAQRPHERRREHDVADEPWADQKDLLQGCYAAPDANFVLVVTRITGWGARNAPKGMFTRRRLCQDIKGRAPALVTPLVRSSPP